MKQSHSKRAVLVFVPIIALLTSSYLSADVLHYDDVIITGSECIGFDCVNGESFGYDTQKFKENNLRMFFEDTSIGSFPTNDWRIMINDTTSGGASYFSVQDATAGKRVFTIEAGAPAHSLYVEDYGRVGLGTSIPYVELHIKDGDSPTIRLDQDGSSGWVAQSWDMAGNETNFFIRDVTNGSKLSFRIQPNTPSSTLSLKSTGYVGIGTWSPAGKLHIEDSGPTKLIIHNTSNGGETTNSWKFNHANDDNLRLAHNDSDGTEFTFSPNGNLQMAGSLTTGGTTCGGGGCDLVFHPDTVIDSIEEHARKMWSNSYLPAVGPTKENAPFNITEKTGGILNELEKAHIYIEELNSILKTKDSEIDALKKRYAEIDDLKQRLATLEKHLKAKNN